MTWSIWKMNEERDATLEAAGKSSIIDRWTRGESEEDVCLRELKANNEMIMAHEEDSGKRMVW